MNELHVSPMVSPLKMLLKFSRLSNTVIRKERGRKEGTNIVLSYVIRLCVKLLRDHGEEKKTTKMNSEQTKFMSLFSQL